MASAPSPLPSPALAPPAGHMPYFDASNDLAIPNIVTQTLCITIPTILMATRIYARVRYANRWAIEDWACLLSWSMLLPYAAMTAMLVAVGGGKHQYDVTVDTLQRVLYWTNMAQIIYSMSILATKASLLVIYMALFSPSRKSRIWWFIIIFLVANAIFYVGLMLVKIFACWPRDAIWNKAGHPDAKCLNIAIILDLSGTWNVLSDAIILAIPMYMVSTLNLSKEKKIGVFAIFAVGVIGPIFSLVGLVERTLNAASPDLTYYQPRILFFAEAEIATGIICSCLPALPRLVRKRKPGHAAQISSTNPRSYAYYERRRTGALSSSMADKTFLNSDYIELNESGTRRSPIAYPSRARGSGEKGENLEAGGIWKTVEIEHTVARRDDVSSDSDAMKLHSGDRSIGVGM